MSVVGRKAPDFAPDTFWSPTATRRPWPSWPSARSRSLQLNYKIDNGKAKTAGVSEWKGGERYGDENKHYYGEFRGVVKGTKRRRQGQGLVHAARRNRRDVESEPFTYTVKQNTGAKVLVIADEDYNGVNPDLPEPATARR